MNDISRLVKLRFLILKLLKNSKSKMTIENILMKLPRNSWIRIEDVSNAVCELNSYNIITVEYMEGFNAHAIPIQGHRIISVEWE